MIRTYRSLLMLTFCLIITGVAMAQQPDVSVPPSIDIDPPAGQTRTIPIIVTNNPGIDSYALKLTYPTSILTFQNTSNAGTGTDGWISSTGQENTPGEITIGGFNTTAFTTDDTLINVIFVDTGAGGAGLIQLSNFGDDLVGASTTDGVINNSVPVELVSFSAEVTSDAVTLTWLTSSESNNFGFDIEKSFDNELFTKIGFERGHGTTLEPNRYTFTDSDLNRNQTTRYYRLKQIDFDGSFDFSGVLTVELANPESFVLRQNFPNPFNPETTISYELPQPSRVSLVIYNLQGQAIRNLLNQEMPAGFHSVQWNGKDNRGIDVSSGVYIYKMSTNGFEEVKKLSLIR